jgi:HlyD family secretion protein
MNRIMKRKALIIIAVAGLLVVLLLIFKPLAKKDSAVTFETAKVERGNINNTVTATGTIEAIVTVTVGTQVSGILKDVYVDFNDVVKKGQVLARLDETSLKAQLEQSQSQVDQAQAQLNFQEATYNRLKVLYDKKLIAQADYDQALYNYENSKAALSNAKSNLARAKVNLEYATITSPIDGVVLNRAVEAGQTVAASFNTPTLFTIVNDLTQMEVQTSVDEADIGKVNKGQRVEFSVDAYPEMKFEGNVSEVRLQPVTTNNVVTYVVILSAPNPEKKLMPGMTASATIFVEEKSNALILSGKALRFTPDQEYMKKMMEKTKSEGIGPNTASAAGSRQMNQRATSPSAMRPSSGTNGAYRQGNMSKGNAEGGMKVVWVKDGKAGIKPVPVTTGIDNGSNVEILTGLKEGDEVVISMSGGNIKTQATKTEQRPRGPFPF